MSSGKRGELLKEAWEGGGHMRWSQWWQWMLSTGPGGGAACTKVVLTKTRPSTAAPSSGAIHRRGDARADDSMPSDSDMRGSSSAHAERIFFQQRTCCRRRVTLFGVCRREQAYCTVESAPLVGGEANLCLNRTKKASARARGHALCHVATCLVTCNSHRTRPCTRSQCSG